ncbi:MAG: hypothetical protein WC503_05270 [Candidatus Shapirobacteria bacterium]
MPIDPLKIAIKGSTQDNLPIEDIVDGIVILKDGSASKVLQVSSVNFDLLSEKEQSALIFAYGGILNSLNFNIQIVINSTTKDVGNYLNNLELAKNSQQNEKLRERIASYKKFIEETVKRNDVLSKTFFIVIPFSSIELGIKQAKNQIFNTLNPIKKEVQLPYSKEYIVEKAKAALQPKEDHLIRLFSRLGLEIKALNTKELIELFYKIYNEDTANNQKLQNVNYTAPAVIGK